MNKIIKMEVVKVILNTKSEYIIENYVDMAPKSESKIGDVAELIISIATKDFRRNVIVPVDSKIADKIIKDFNELIEAQKKEDEPNEK